MTEQVQTKIYLCLGKDDLPGIRIPVVTPATLFESLASLKSMRAVLWIPDESVAESLCQISPFLPNARTVLPKIADDVYPPWFVKLKMTFPVTTAESVLLDLQKEGVVDDRGDLIEESPLKDNNQVRIDASVLPSRDRKSKTEGDSRRSRPFRIKESDREDLSPVDITSLFDSGGRD